MLSLRLQNHVYCPITQTKKVERYTLNAIVQPKDRPFVAQSGPSLFNYQKYSQDQLLQPAQSSHNASFTHFCSTSLWHNVHTNQHGTLTCHPITLLFQSHGFFVSFQVHTTDHVPQVCVLRLHVRGVEGFLLPTAEGKSRSGVERLDIYTIRCCDASLNHLTSPCACCEIRTWIPDMKKLTFVLLALCTWGFGANADVNLIASLSTVSSAIQPSGTTVTIKDPASLVNLFIGTRNGGHTFPGNDLD